MAGRPVSIGVGVIGAGVTGAEHIRILHDLTSGARVAAVCDADPARAAIAARGARIFSDPRELITSPEVEAVIIASPDATHAACVTACLAAGKPVLCEKPLSVTAAEALNIVEAEAATSRRLAQVGFMRRFDVGYHEMRDARIDGRIGATVLLHNIHRNAAAPAWFVGAMSLTNSFVHEIDISRWLLGTEMTSVQVVAAPTGDPLMILMRTDKGEIVSTEVFMNAGYGYHVHAQLVGAKGTIEMGAPTRTLTNLAGAQSFGFPSNWVPRFTEAYVHQLQAWVDAIAAGVPGGAKVGASAWDGFVATAIAEQAAESLANGVTVEIVLPPRPSLYAP